MSSPRYGWWGYAKHMTRRYPDRVNEDERMAVEAALAETERMRDGRARLAVVELVLFRGTHNLAGAALQVPVSERTAQRWHGEFLRAVGRNFHCDGLK